MIVQTHSETFPLEPEGKHRLIDCLHWAGLNVDDWDGMPQNPAHCFHWSFSEPNNNLFVFNIWVNEIKRSESGAITCTANQRAVMDYASQRGQTRRYNKAERFDRNLSTAFHLRAPCRVVLLDGSRKSCSDRQVVRTRELDPVPWRVSYYRMASGAARLERLRD